MPQSQRRSPPVVSRRDYDDAMRILTELHRWQLSDDAIARAFSQVSKVSAKAFERVYDGAIAKTGYYKPADFIGELKETHRQQLASPTRRALPPGQHRPDAAMWARLRKHLAYVRENAGREFDDDGLPVDLDAHWVQVLADPVTAEELAAVASSAPAVDEIVRSMS